MESTMGQTTEQSRSVPNYLLAFGAGILVALAASPVHRLVVAMTYNEGYYSDWPILMLLLGAVIGLVMRWAGGGSADIVLAVLAGLIALIGLLLSEYLVMHYLVNQYLLEEGWVDKALLIQPPDVALVWMWEYFSLNSINLVMGVIGIGFAVFVNVRQDLWSGSRWSPDARKRRLFELSPKARQDQSLDAPTAYDAPPVSGIKVPEEAYDLGLPIREYGPALWKLGGIALITTALALFMVVSMFSIEPEDVFVIIFMLIPFCGFAIYRLVLLFINLNNHVIIFEDGISISQQGKNHLFRWDEIDRVYHNKMVHQQGVIPITYAHFYRLCRRDGTEVALRPRFEKFNELGSTIHQAVTKCQIPQAIETLKKGMPLDFETMRITREGIRFHDKKNTQIPWAEVGQATVWQGTIRVSSKRKGYAGKSVSMAKTANPHLFFTFVEKATAPKQQQPGT